MGIGLLLPLLHFFWFALIARVHSLSSAATDKNVLLVGVSGGTGPRAVQGLLDAGWAASRLHVLSRNPSSRTCLGLRSSGCRIVEADLEDKISTARAVEAARANFVYVHGTGGDTKELDALEVIRAKTLATVLSSTSAPELVTYNSAAADPGHGVARIQQKHDCEVVFREAALPLCALRANLFMEELWKDYTRPAIVEKRRFTFSVPGDKPIYLTSVRDMGHVAGALFARPDLRESVIDVASDVKTPKQMAHAFGADFKRDRFFYWISKLFAPELHQIIRFYTTSNLRVDIDRLRADLGPDVLTSFDDFLQETAWFDLERTYESLAFDVSMPSDSRHS